MDLSNGRTVSSSVSRAGSPGSLELADFGSVSGVLDLSLDSGRRAILLGQVRLAARVCKLLSRQLSNGGTITTAAAKSCAILALEYLAEGP